MVKNDDEGIELSISGNEWSFFVSTDSIYLEAGEVAYHLMSGNANNVHQVEVKALFSYTIK